MRSLRRYMLAEEGWFIILSVINSATEKTSTCAITGNMNIYWKYVLESPQLGPYYILTENYFGLYVDRKLEC